MGGIGKTELAIQYALYAHERKAYPGGICWLRAREAEIGIQIIDFARTQLKFISPKDLELESQVRACWRNWRSGEVLTILDDLTEYKTIKKYLPPVEKRFKILITTRKQWIGQSFKQIDLDVLEEKEAIELLKSIAGESRTREEISTAKKICQWLGYLPLGIELVGKYLKCRPNLSLNQMLKRLKSKRLEQKALQKPSEDATANLGVKDALELSWQELDKPAQKMGCLLSLLALAPIPWKLVKQCEPEIDPEELEDIRDESLLNPNLLQNIGEETYQLHHLVREFLRDKLEGHTQEEELKRRVCRTIVKEAQKIEETPTRQDLLAIAPSIPHIEEVAKNLEDWLEDEDLVWLFIGLGRFYEGQSAYKGAEKWYRQCLKATRNRLGNDHPDVASSLNNLALLYESQGRYEKAEPLYLQALELRKRLLGDDHPDVATSLNNLAGLYKSQGHYEEAEPLYLQALELYKRLLGNDHPHVAYSLNNLAVLYYNQGRYKEAESLFLQALIITERMLGPNHPHTITLYENLILMAAFT